jgi:Skp family chaperone for outer membrane proteins
MPLPQKTRAYAAYGVIAALAAVTLNAAHAAESPAVAVVNVDRILKEHKPLNNQLDPLKAEAKEFEAAVQVRQAEMESVAGKVRQTPPSAPEYERLQVQFARLRAELEQFVLKGRRDLQQKEMALYLAFFRQLDAEISKYAKAHGLKLVLRQSQTSLEDNQSPEDVAKALNRQILFEDGVDITDAILKGLAASSTGAQK